MCIIIVANVNKRLSNRIIKRAYKNNPDGFGIAASINGKLEVIKGLYKPSKIIKIYNQLRAKASGDIVLHFRIATRGNVTDSLCHPFYVNKDLVMFHNGVEIDEDIAGHSCSNKDESDTMAFVNNILKNFKKGFQKNKNIMNMISKSVGNNNRLCFLDSNGVTTYSSSDLWVESKGILYSNPNLFYDDNYRYINPATMDYVEDDYHDEYYDSEYFDEYMEYKDNIDYYKDYEEVTMGDDYDYVNYGRMDEYYDDRIFN